MTNTPKAIGIARLLLIGVLCTALSACKESTEADLISEAKVALGKQDYMTAVLQSKLALSKAPSSAEARYLLGVALLEQGDGNAALGELKKAGEAGYSEAALSPKRARAMIATGKSKQVLTEFAETTVEGAKNQGELRTAVALAHLVNRQQAQAEKALADAEAAAPKQAWTQIVKAGLLAARGDVDQALLLLDQAATDPARKGEALHFKGTILYSAKNDIDGAIKTYELAAQDRYQEVGSRSALIGLHAERGQMDEAKAQLAALQKSNPNHPSTTYSDAYLAFKLGQLDAANKNIEKLIKIVPNSRRVLLLGGMIDIKRGALVSAESKLGRAVNVGGDTGPSRKLLADAYLAMGNGEKAIATLRPLLDAKNQDAEALIRAGHAALLMGDSGQAGVFYSAADRLKPGDGQIRMYLALRDLSNGLADKAFESLNEIAAKDSGTSVDLALISAHFKRREFDEALTAVDRLKAKKDTGAVASHLRGEALRAKGDVAGARQAYEDALKVQPLYFASVAALAMMDIAESKFPAARQRLDAAITQFPGSSAARLLRVRVMTQQGAKKEEIADALLETVRVNPTDVAARLAQIEQFFKESDNRSALTAAQAADAAIPDQPALIDALGRAYFATRDFRQAVSTYGKLSTLMPKSAVPHLKLAAVYEQQGDLATAKQSVRRAFEADPRSNDLRIRLLKLAKQSRDAAFAIDLTKELQKKSPNLAIGYVLGADMEAARKNYAAALPLYKEALRKSDAGPEVAQRVVDTYEALGQKPNAASFADGWLKDHPKDLAFMEHLGQRALLRNDKAVAERWFTAVVNQAPKHGPALNNLAWLMASRKAPGSVAMAERAVALMPDQAPVLDTYARALAAENKLPDAVAAQKRTIAMAPNQPEYRLVLAELYAQAGDRAKALEELKDLEALGEKFPQQKAVAEMKRRLDAR